MTDLVVKPVDPQWVVESLQALPFEEGLDSVKRDYLIKEITSKFFDPKTGNRQELRNQAYASMVQAEEICLSVNEHGLQVDPAVLYRASQICAKVLGDVDFSMFADSRFTNGATVGHTRKTGDAYYKYHGDHLTVTADCYKYAMAVIRNTPLWEEHLLERFGCIPLQIVPGGKFDTVPKNSKTDREIEPQPTMNVALQRSVGLYLRSRLKNAGIDLRDQSINQRLAQYGSSTGSLATLDLKMASSLISDRVVFELLPCEWYALLDELRTRGASFPDDLGGGFRRWERFSSMGNGFTFELESLIFFSLAKAALEVHTNLRCIPGIDISVYGDDLIVPSAGVDTVIDVLEGSGFIINLDKSFWAGPFRESCGKHYHNGVDISPFYIRKPIDTLHRVVWLLNSLRKWASTSVGCDPRIYDLWLRIRRDHCPSWLLGHWDIDSQEAVYSPHKPRKRLVLKRRTRPIDGRPALLRRWQGLNHDDLSSFGFSGQTFSPSSNEVPRLGIRVKRVENIQPSTRPTCRPHVYLFPQEA